MARVYRFHQLGEQIAIGYGHLLELLEPRRGLVGVALVQQLGHGDLVLLFLLRGPDGFDQHHRYWSFSRALSSRT